eukprot:scaffold13550_cov130-Amphora_coffeaeformis.AAC.1
MFGPQAVVPGSHPSGHFDKQKLEDALSSLNTTSPQQWWESKRVVYSHRLFQQINNNKKKKEDFET